MSITMNALDRELAHFTGTANYWKHGLTQYVYTDGVKHMAEYAQAYWLIDIVMSHQATPKVRNAEFQIWTLSVKDSAGFITCKEDLNTPVLAKQKFDFTDFPEGEFKLYFTNGVLLLPSEY